jgi:hypothetical protein
MLGSRRGSASRSAPLGCIRWRSEHRGLRQLVELSAAANIIGDLDRVQRMLEPAMRHILDVL